MIGSEETICSCSTFSVRSRLVIPLCMCSKPARALNSSIRAFTSCLVIFSRAAMLARSTCSTTAAYASITVSGSSPPKSTPRSRCADSTASQSRRSAMILFSGLHTVRIASEAYRLARTLGTLTAALLSSRRPPRLRAISAR